jgi:coenzyme Q-binding protein COQ10
MGYVEKTIEFEAPAKAVYELAKDMESYPDFMPDVESVIVVSREGNTTITEWETSVDGTPILWTEKDIFDDETLTIDYQLIEGDLDQFEGRWTFTQNEQHCTVTLTVEYDFGIPELTKLIGPTLETKVGENSSMMLEGLKAKYEQLNESVVG